ncbi:MAG: M18 family aminopeptidase, partial [Longicatena sp.]
MSNKTISNFMTFIQNSPSCFHAVEELRKEFHKEGFVQLFESKQWKLEKGGKYYVIRNGSSIISFTIGEEVQEEYSFQ